MSGLTSTVPGALAMLVTKFKAVASANPTLNIEVLLGEAMGPGEPSPNYLMVGNWETGELIANYKQDFRGMPAVSAWKNEDYVIPCNLRAWAGTAPPASPTAPQARLTSAFGILDGVLRQLQADPSGSGALSSSGTWQVTSIEMPMTGPWPAVGGWGVLMVFDVHVFNVTLTN